MSASLRPATGDRSAAAQQRPELAAPQEGDGPLEGEVGGLRSVGVAHGWVHLVFVFPRPDPSTTKPDAPRWPSDMDASWAIRRIGLDARVVRAVCRALMGVAFVAFLLAALATVGILVPVGWWAGLVLAGSVASIVLLATCHSTPLLLGLAIDVALIVLVVAGAWRPIA